MAKLRKRTKDAVECIQWLWKELHRTDLGDSEHYPNGFRKFSCFEPGQYVRLGLSVIALILSLIALYVSKQ